MVQSSQSFEMTGAMADKMADKNFKHSFLGTRFESVYILALRSFKLSMFCLFQIKLDFLIGGQTFKKLKILITSIFLNSFENGKTMSKIDFIPPPFSEILICLINLRFEITLIYFLKLCECFFQIISKNSTKCTDLM